MTDPTHYNLTEDLLELVSAQRLDALPELFRAFFNVAMQLEREQFLKATAYQRTPERQGHANGFKPKTLKTRVAETPGSIPQAREGGFYPQSLESVAPVHPDPCHGPSSTALVGGMTPLKGDTAR